MKLLVEIRLAHTALLCIPIKGYCTKIPNIRGYRRKHIKFKSGVNLRLKSPWLISPTTTHFFKSSKSIR